MVQVTAKDEQGTLAPFGLKQQGNTLIQGPPTTLSATGADNVAFLQAALNRDTTFAVNGSAVGSRDAFVVRRAMPAQAHALPVVLCLPWQREALIPGTSRAMAKYKDGRNSGA